jgi:hypothetical protein
MNQFESGSASALEMGRSPRRSLAATLAVASDSPGLARGRLRRRRAVGDGPDRARFPRPCRGRRIRAGAAVPGWKEIRVGDTGRRV